MTVWRVTLSLYFFPPSHPSLLLLPSHLLSSALCSLSPPLPSIESQPEPTSVRGRYLVTTEKSIISTKQRRRRGEGGIMKERSSFCGR